MAFLNLKIKTKMKKKLCLKYVHIHAKCEYFEIFEQVEESKSVERLLEIKQWFLEQSRKDEMIQETSNAFTGVSLLYNHAEKLSVKTRLVNPELF